MPVTLTKKMVTREPTFLITVPPGCEVTIQAFNVVAIGTSDEVTLDGGYTFPLDSPLVFTVPPEDEEGVELYGIAASAHTPVSIAVTGKH